MTKKKLNLPNGLLDAMREQRALLFLGSGASLGAKTPSGTTMPNASKLVEAIADRFLTSKFKDKDLMRVSELAVSQAGTTVFYQWLREIFEPFAPTEAHKNLANFRWRAIATTNYDLLVEKGYHESPSEGQTLVKRFKDAQPIETMLSQYSHPLEYLKLHGCIEHVHDKEVPPVMTPSSYNDHEANRKNLYSRLENLGSEYPIIFCGHSLDDLHIHRLIDNPRNSSRPMYYLISPSLEAEEIQMWASKRVQAIRGTFEQFMSELDVSLPPLMRIPNQTEGADENPYRKQFRVQESESDETNFAFKNEFTFLHAGLKIADVSANRFYAGYDQSWGNIAQNYDVHRRASHQVLENIGAGDSENTQLRVITGAAGYGKTIALMRAAWELAVSFGEFVVWLDDDSKMRPDVLRELYSLLGKRIYIFSDRSGLNCPKIEAILALSKGENIPVTLVTAERKNEWSMYCQRLEKYNPEYFEINKLSEKEITELLKKLEVHDCEGILKGKSEETKRTTIVQKLDRQLLVALYEITRGKSFEEIVMDEYYGITPKEAQDLYLDICTLHRYDVPVRAGVISRISDISFRDFETEFFEPLEDLVFSKQNSTTGDREYRSRHSIVSEMVFSQICQTDENRHDQIIRLIDGLDTNFGSDNLALSHLMRGHNMANTFENITLARQVYEIAILRNPSQSYLKQHLAIFEYRHKDGSLENADAAISEALTEVPNSPSFLHTQAQIHRIRASNSDSDFAKHTLRSRARATLDKIPDQNNAYVLGSRARLRVDAVSDALQELTTNQSEVNETLLTEAVDQAELALHRAFNMYPADPDFLEAEAKLKELLGDKAASTSLLKRAWEKMPRGSGVAKRLAHRYLQDEETDLAISVLTEAIERDPSDRSVNLLLANIHFKQSGDLDDVKALSYLAQSYVNGDREYYARLVASAVAFARKDFENAYTLVDEIHTRAPSDFSPKLGKMETWLKDKLASQTGILKNAYGSYVFITMRDSTRDIYAPAYKSDDVEWDNLKVQGRVSFDIEFHRKGPVAINVKNLN
ncbi:SIR2 family protein [Amylibacter ulvae]|uniref:SIR2 family protein n=1 Tax=Paramylibacter ulvae TaxID=1651968 RepID=A0ABQ3D310_9RHOB|nr:SIR2 family protein [Amylibacter ulvae]GHA54006.1 SIR2 family protein [Amylibacter ulvae]